MGRYILYALLAGAYIHSARAAYQLVKDYSGPNFFDSWNFFSDQDPTAGFVRYQTQPAAVSQGLIAIQSNGNNDNNAQTQAFMGVDFTHITPNGRPSVRIESQDTFNHALIIADFAHMPGGICGTWPAYWLIGKGSWPDSGEIDILEGVHEQRNNAMTLHTRAGVQLNSASAHKSTFTGQIETLDCDVNAKDQPINAGCTIKDESTQSYGTGFNDAGGGVYAMQWTSRFIKVWFFPRNGIPRDVAASESPSPETWGKPSASFRGEFNVDRYFKDMRIVFDTTFCGFWAGEVWKTSSCASKAPTCDDFVRDNPHAFQDAYWLVNHVKVYQDNAKPPASASPTASVTTQTIPPRPTRTQTVTVTVTETSSVTPVNSSKSTGQGPATETSQQQIHTCTRTRTTPRSSIAVATTVSQSSATPTRVITLSGLRRPTRFGGAVLPATAAM